jgi:hypothetical protein
LDGESYGVGVVVCYAVPGHHRHYIVVARQKIEPARNLVKRSGRACFRCENQLPDVARKSGLGSGGVQPINAPAEMAIVPKPDICGTARRRAAFANDCILARGHFWNTLEGSTMPRNEPDHSTPSRDSNPRRPAWEDDRKLETKTLHFRHLVLRWRIPGFYFVLWLSSQRSTNGAHL